MKKFTVILATTFSIFAAMPLCALQEKPLAKLAQAKLLYANPQTGSTCGYHATFNAKAIQDLVQEGKAITEKNVQEYARKYFHHLSNHSLETVEIIMLARVLGLKNVYFLAYDKKIGVKPAGVFDVEHDLDTMLQTAKTKKAALAHFICNTGNHWVLLSLIKKPGKKPYLVYLDSINGKVTLDSPSHKLITYLSAAIAAKPKVA